MDQICGQPPTTQTTTVRRAKRQILYNTFGKNCDSYVQGEHFAVANEVWGRRFSFHGETTSIIARKEGEIVDKETGEVVSFSGKEVIKKADKFAAHNTEETFLAFLKESQYYGCHRPSSYYDVFHAQFYSPRVLRSINETFAPWARFGWQEALRTGQLAGRWTKYDLNSAYLWATTLGLPRMETAEHSDYVGTLPGLYRVRIGPDTGKSGLPYPLGVMRDVNLSTEEIDYYGIPIERVYGGIVWRDLTPPSMVTDVVRQFSFGKQVSKGFWGRWASTDSLSCSTYSGKMWRLPNASLNLVWAHIIVSRIKMRLWEVTRLAPAAHVYVDSIVTQARLPTGTGLGEWKIERAYPNGVYVGRTGCVGERQDRLHTNTGIAKEYEF
jgi:hypothetical protein